MRHELFAPGARGLPHGRLGLCFDPARDAAQRQAKYLYLDCRAADAKQARSWAAPWRDQIDQALSRIEAAAIRSGQDRFGEPRDIGDLQASLRILNDVNFRYYAGFLGWEDPDVQTRLTRFSAAEKRWRDLVANEVVRLDASSPRVGDWQTIGRGVSARPTATRCPAGRCITIDLKSSSGPLPGCHPAPEIGDVALAFVDAQGGWQWPAIDRSNAEGHTSACDGSPVAQLVLTPASSSARFIVARIEDGSSDQPMLAYWRLPPDSK